MSRTLCNVGVSGVALAILYVFAVLTWPGQVVDEWVLGAAQRLGVGPLSHCWPLLARRIIPVLAAAAVVLLALAALRHRAQRVLCAFLLLGLSTGVSLTLKHSLPRPLHGDGIGYLTNTFPSTHASATLALIVAAWWLVPRRPTWLVDASIVAAGSVAIGNVVGHAHRPSDVLGSVLVVSVVAQSLRAVMPGRVRRYPDGAAGGPSAAGRG